jgi:hypothetical protein
MHVSNRESIRRQHSILWFCNIRAVKKKISIFDMYIPLLWHSYISNLFLTKMQVKFSILFHHGSLNVIGDKFRFVRSTCTYLSKRFRLLSSTKTGSYPHEFLCRTDCSACADYQPCLTSRNSYSCGFIWNI